MKEFLVSKKITVKDALKKLDKAGEKILFVVNKNEELIGALSDGNIRRYILKGGKLNSSINDVYNKSPVYVHEPFRIPQVRKIMHEKRIEAIPILNKENKIKDIVFLDNIIRNSDRNKAPQQKLNIPLVIMAGGKGVRLDPFTKILPKPLIPIGEKPIIEIIMDKFSNSGINDFYVILNYKGEMIKSYFASNNKQYNITYINEDEFSGTAGGLRLLPNDIPNTFIVSNCDIIVDADYGDVLSFHKSNNDNLTVVGSIQHYVIPYGIVEFGNRGVVKKIAEKPEFDFTINTGVYVLNKKVLKYLPDNGVFHITDLANLLLKDKRKVSVYPVSEKSYIDIGQWGEYKKVIDKFEKLV